MPLRTIAADLVRLFENAAGPVYALDEKRRIVFANEACAAWAGCLVGDLLGHETRYHSSPEVKGPAAVAALLAPPPDVWNGRPAAAVVSLVGLDGASVSRRVDFVPLMAGALDVAGVIAVAAAEALDENAMTDAEAAGAEQSSRLLHERLARWRSQLAGRNHLDRLVGTSAQMRQVRGQIELAVGSTANEYRLWGQSAADGSTWPARFITDARRNRPDRWFLLFARYLA